MFRIHAHELQIPIFTDRNLALNKMFIQKRTLLKKKSNIMWNTSHVAIQYYLEHMPCCHTILFGTHAMLPYNIMWNTCHVAIQYYVEDMPCCHTILCGIHAMLPYNIMWNTCHVAIQYCVEHMPCCHTILCGTQAMLPYNIMWNTCHVAIQYYVEHMPCCHTIVEANCGFLRKRWVRQNTIMGNFWLCSSRNGTVHSVKETCIYMCKQCS